MEVNTSSQKSYVDIKSEDIDDDIDIADEFIDTVLKQVERLCETITNGDPNLQRKTEVNQNLNEAVSCYRVKLLYKQCNIEEKDQDKKKNDISSSNPSNSVSKVLKPSCEEEVLVWVLPSHKWPKGVSKSIVEYISSPEFTNSGLKELEYSNLSVTHSPLRLENILFT